VIGIAEEELARQKIRIGLGHRRGGRGGRLWRNDGNGRRRGRGGRRSYGRR
jgi:hypothetical protein